ncbi:PASTA domain-containing protein [Nocardia alni]|uniref:PASTA domain-containing protein n=1 Tax=Nocardia alni TaxID=2815723 RepID=UPI001C24B617|nr:PASTA domain-containing protein [Nocardia alni]
MSTAKPGEDAWKRLTAKRRGSRSGEDALSALDDIGAVRRLLDQWELDAVRVARGEARSWAEIATYLGVTRQSAWERWRDLDQDEPAPVGHATESAQAPAELARRTTDEGPVAGAVREVLSSAARERRRRSTVKVPAVVGMEWINARDALAHNNLVAFNAEPDSPVPDPGDSGWIVTDQSPESGARVAAGSAVRLWLRRDGGSGVREPRQPMPPLRSIPELPEPSDSTTA